MNEERRVLIMDEYDQNIIIRALNDLRNEQIRNNKSTDALDELILRAAYAQKKKMKIRGDSYDRS